MASNIGKAIAVIGAGVGGYAKGKDISETRKERKADREFKKSERERELAARDELAAITSRYGSMFNPQQVSPAAAGIAGQPLPAGAPAVPQQGAAQTGPAGGVNVARAPQPFATPAPADLQAYSRELDVFSATHPQMAKQLEPLRANLRQLGNREWAQGFQGDKLTPAGSLEYVQYMAKSPFGAGYIKPEVAIEIADRMDKLEKQGFGDILKFGHMGDMAQAQKAWKKAKMPGELVQLRPAKFQFGDTNEIIWKDKSGKEHTYNAGEKYYRGLTLKEQAKMSIDEQRIGIEEKKLAAADKKALGSTAMIQNAEWLMRSNVAASAKDAIKILNTAKHSPQKSVIDLTQKILAAQQKNYIDASDPSFQTPEMAAETAKSIVQAALNAGTPKTETKPKPKPAAKPSSATKSVGHSALW